MSEPNGQAREEDFGHSPSEWASRWQMELAAARKELERWHKQGDTVIKRYRDERESKAQGDTRWNLYWSNIQTQSAILYGKTPAVDVSRRFADANDDSARVAGEILERLLNLDLQGDSDSSAEAYHYALMDRLLPGFACVRLRYVPTFEQVEAREAVLDEATGRVLAEAVEAHERVSDEQVETDYVHWKDMLWSPARVWHEVRWVAFRAEMSRRQLVERFGEELGKLVPLNAKRSKRSSDEDAQRSNPWARAEVWEIWDKETGAVFWYVDGFDRVLDTKEDPLGLEGFWPCPRPMMANLTTSSLVPRTDYGMVQDLYEEIDSVSTRITLLEQAIVVRGVYSKQAEEVKQLLTRTTQNQLIPVENWPAFSEKGGLKGMVDWLPLDQIVAALTSLRDYRRELLDSLHQITGMSDIMRGQATAAGATATEQRIKAQFGSVRMQAMQDEFARFVTDAQKLKAEIIAKHFQPETILRRCNCEFTPDAPLAPKAVELIKSRFRDYRIEVKPENVSLTDFAALKDEKMEMLSGLTTALQSAGGLVQQVPGSLPFVLQIIQWCMAGLKGSATIEGVLDQAIEAAKKAAEQPQGQQGPSPEQMKLEAVKLKGQLDIQKEQMKQQGDLQRIAAETQADAQREAVQRVENVREAAAKAQISVAIKAAQPQQPVTPRKVR